MHLLNLRNMPFTKTRLEQTDAIDVGQGDTLASDEELRTASGLFLKSLINLGTGSGIFTQKINATIQLRGLKAAGHLYITGNTDSLTFNSNIRHFVKRTDEVINNNAALHNDADLIAPVERNQIYQVEIQLILNSVNAGSDWKFQFSVPIGTIFYWGTHSGNINQWDPAGTGGSADPLLTNNIMTIGNGANDTIGLFIRGTLVVGNTAGNIVLQWAQNTAKTNNSTMLKGSMMRITKL